MKSVSQAHDSKTATYFVSFVSQALPTSSYSPLQSSSMQGDVLISSDVASCQPLTDHPVGSQVAIECNIWVCIKIGRPPSQNPIRIQTHFIFSLLNIKCESSTSLPYGLPSAFIPRLHSFRGCCARKPATMAANFHPNLGHQDMQPDVSVFMFSCTSTSIRRINFRRTVDPRVAGGSKTTSKALG